MNHYLFGYGSLVNDRSRSLSMRHTTFSPVFLHGWRRSWTSRHYDEGLTYFGAYPDGNSRINGVLGLTPPEILNALQKRETYYRPSKVSFSDVEFVGDSVDFVPGPVWIWEATEELVSDEAFPVAQTYIDTCILGCLEMVGTEFASAFIRLTPGWDEAVVIDDRATAKYPRYDTCAAKRTAEIDSILKRR